MVRALLAGTKTQTRRVMKLQPHHFYAGAPYGPPDRSGIPDGGGVGYPRIDCPYGVPADRLWVRETFVAFGRWETRFSDAKGRDEWHFVDMTLYCGRKHLFDADLPDTPRTRGQRKPDSLLPMWWRRPAIFMPRAVSRITLEVTGVRVERLQDIGEKDSRAEGAPGYEEGFDAPPPDDEHEWSYRASYRRVWEAINGPDSWTANPWLWVIEFRTAEPWKDRGQ